MASDSEDKRDGGRRPIELKVEYKRLNAFFADYTRNISHGGTFIATSKPLPIGTEFVFKLAVPKLSEPMSIIGEVRWVVEPGGEDEEEPGMGIRFLYKEEGEREAIAALVEGLMVDSLGRLLTAKLLAQAESSDGNEDEGV